MSSLRHRLKSISKPETVDSFCDIPGEQSMGPVSIDLPSVHRHRHPQLLRAPQD
jgi:hypothetical protein